MIDFHNHILPGVDDGSKNIEMSINMLRSAQEQGITDVINTVHFQHPKVDKKKITSRLVHGSISKLQERIDNEGINIRVHPGAEVFFKHNLTDIIDNPITTMGKGKYMLIEFPVLQFPTDYQETLFNLNLKGVTPIIAHPERYREIISDIDKLKALYSRGYFIQIDAGSIIGHFGEQVMKCAQKIINEGLFHFIGSDAHNNRTRNFCIGKLLNINYEIINNNYETLFFDNPMALIDGRKINKLSMNKPLIKKHTVISRIFSKINNK